MDRRLLGRWGEAAAAAWLRRQGYTVLAANYATRFGEIDLIAWKGNYLAFIEVKLRKSADFAAAREFVDARKQKRLRIVAAQYLQEHPSELQPRFDVAEVYAPDGAETKQPKINYIENAFQ
ncbi:MAG TPA: YraN family protein [Oscillospiraceae bacterium]|nr:YraN family protein [Oscillospiraceae bacterium]